MAIAVSSSLAIAAWTHWADLAYWWGLIIVAGQVASVILEYKPYEERKRELSKAITLKKPIYLEMEHKWDQININPLRDIDLSNLLKEFEEKWNETEEQVFENSCLEQDMAIKDQAQSETKLYFENMYEVKKNEGTSQKNSKKGSKKGSKTSS